jgi:hypothetical protein
MLNIREITANAFFSVDAGKLCDNLAPIVAAYMLVVAIIVNAGI